ncbi:hypothetical protein ACLOJK_007357 [Asimina triloba]
MQTVHAFLHRAMATSSFTHLSLLLLLLLTTTSASSAAAASSSCSSESFPGNKSFSFCEDLPQLSASLHWTYTSSKSSLDVAFIAPPASPEGWIAWAINPTLTGMIGAQTLIAFRQPDGFMAVKTSDIKAYGPIQISEIAFKVSNMEGDLVGGSSGEKKMRIFATFQLPATMETLHHVWQVGSSVTTDGVPEAHAFEGDNLSSKATLNLASGKSTAGEGGDPIPTDKKIHGILNVVGWGILIPIGALVARHLRRVESTGAAWFYIHVSCQCTAYAMAVAGFATGLILGKKSPGVQYSRHRNIGIALFVLGTVQALALLLRPKPDHKYRYFWNCYHHSVGYAAIFMGAANIFLGLSILGAAPMWKTAYIVWICVLLVSAVAFEIASHVRRIRKLRQQR